MKLSPDEWAFWVLLGDPNQRWPTPLNELAKRIKRAIEEDRIMREMEKAD